MFFFFILILVAPFAAASQSVLIIKSGDNSYFNQTIEKLLNTTEQQVKFRILLAEEFTRSPPTTSPEVIITLGYLAAQAVRQMPDTPVIHAYMTESQTRERSLHDKHYTLLLDQPLERYLDLIRELLGTPRVGLIRVEPTQISESMITRSEKNSGLELDQRLFE